MGKSGKSLGVVAVVTLIALTFSWFAGSGSVSLFGLSAMFVTGLWALVLNWLAFIPSAAAQSDKFYDSVGALTYLTVTLVAIYAAIQTHGGLDVRSMAVAAFVAVWCIRLGTFLYRRIHAAGGADSRFEKIRVNPARFLVAWTLQGLWVILTASAAVAIITAEKRAPLGVFFWVGSAIWLLGFVFESVADAQKGAFKNDPANRGKFIDVGLWRWCRHPNYFGEITLWTGILVIAMPILAGLSWLVVISPIFVFLLLTRISGINLQDAQAKERWGDDPAYQAYRKATPALFPRPPMG
ncbi:MAG: DUF1295 domain-containing protein [Pseudomonadota bacterium]